MKKEFVEKPHFEKKKKKEKKRKKNLNIVTIMVENFSNLVMLKLKNKFNSSKSVTTISNVDIDKIAMASNNFPCDIKSFK